ncbi:MAG: S41 family peptidase [Vicinamibacteria bacterium]
MTVIRSIAAVLLGHLSFAPAVVLAATPVDPSTARLVGLARVWAHVKYVHPAMATTDVDWDGALLRALPAVERARTDEEYRGALAGLLAELRDPATRLAVEPGAEPSRRTPGVRLEQMDARTVVVTIAVGPSAADPQPDLCARFTEAARAERVVVDLRGTGQPTDWLLRSAVVRCMGRLLAEDVTLAPARYLTHGFYPMQSVTGGAGGGLGPWESGVTIAAAGSVRGEAGRTPRLVFVVDRGSPDVYALLMALQDQGLAQVVQEGAVAAAGVMVHTFDAGGIAMEVRHGERIRGDGGAGFVADAVVPASGVDRARQLLEEPPRAAAPAVANVPLATGAFLERDYSEAPYPDAAHRMLALFRLYAVVDHFFPYKPLMDRAWDETLADFIPRLRVARDETEYALAVSELATRLQDSHVTLASPVLDRHFGTHRPPVRVDLVEGQTVVTEAPPGSGLEAGDVVLSVDGEAASARRARLARYLPASTAARLENKIDIQFLLGPPASRVAIETRGPDGKVRRVEAERTLEGLAPRTRTRTGPAYAVLPSGLGYLGVDRLEPKDVAAAFEAIRGTPGVIVDMRGYPKVGAFAGVPRYLATKPPSAIGGSIRYDGTSGTFWLEEVVDTLEMAPPSERYGGRVVVLADGSTQSAAEYVCQLIRSSTDAIVVGSQTSGANGGVTRTILPGGIVVNFTAQSIRNHDGSRLQRVGIIPDIEVRPTLAGVREGRDELLERAVAVLQEKAGAPANGPDAEEPLATITGRVESIRAEEDGRVPVAVMPYAQMYFLYRSDPRFDESLQLLKDAQSSRRPVRCTFRRFSGRIVAVEWAEEEAPVTAGRGSGGTSPGTPAAFLSAAESTGFEWA